MKLPVLALFDRSLRLESRSRSVMVTRLVLLGILFLALLQVQQVARIGFIGAPGLQFFRSLVYINFFFVTLAGLGYFASAITEEKEELMLGLLRMTNLNPVSILLGKSTSRLWGALLLLLAQLPFTMLAITLGGVGLGQIIAAYCALLAYIFLVCNLALFFSVVFRRTVVAAALTGIGLFIYLVLPAMIQGALQAAAQAGKIDLDRYPGQFAQEILGWLVATSPWTRLREVLTTGFTGWPVGLQVISNLGFGLIWFLAAWAVFDFFTREQHEVAPGRTWTLRWRRQGHRVPARMIGAPAITWKDFHFMQGGPLGLLLKFAAIGAVYLLIFAFLPIEIRDQEVVGGVLIWTSLAAIAIFAAVDASRIFRNEVRWQTLSSLMLLPVSVRELAYRKVAAALLGLVPVLVYLGLGLALVPEGVLKFLGTMLSEPTGVGFFVIGILQFVLFLHLVAFLSLVVKRGALPLAIAIHYVGSIFLWMPFMMLMAVVSARSATGFTIFFAMLGCGAGIVLLHYSIGWRLEKLAAQE